MRPEKELRLAVTMTGGVSLAIWMGGVATELMNLATALNDSEAGVPNDSQEFYRRWLQDKRYTSVRLDVLAGTSAGGLNAALLGAALGWGVKPETFAERLRSTWLTVGSLKNLMRSPFEADPPSLLQGDDYFKAQVEDILSDWESKRSPGARVHMIITCTLITPIEVQYIDESERNIVEADHRGFFEFRHEDLAKKGISRPLALAARTSASYPVAFEPSWLPIGEDVPEDLDDYARFDSSRFAFDGGILANKPLNRALDAIFEQETDIPVDRKLLYVVPVRGAKSSEKPDKKRPPRITQMLGSTVSIPLSQSLRDDLEGIRDHANKVLVQQTNRKSWLVGLPPQVRSTITAQVWDQFRKGRARASARHTLSRALQRRAESELRPGVLEAVSQGRNTVDWHGATYYSTYLQPRWPWGLSALTYVAQVLLDVVRNTAELVFEARSQSGRRADHDSLSPADEELMDVRSDLHALLKDVRTLRSLDDAFWDAALEVAPAKANAESLAAWREWSSDCYGSWPAPADTWADTEAKRKAAEKLSDRVRITAESVSTELEVESLATQVEARSALSTLAAELEEKVDQLQEIVGRGGPVRALLGERTDTLRLLDALGEGDPMQLLTQLWVIQVATQPDGITIEQPIDLVLIHSDHVVALDPHDRDDATEKLAGLQLARFGGFYKRSWRANDYLWGRLDAAERIGDMLGRDSQEVKPLQARIVRHEQTNLREAIIHSEADGAGRNADAVLLIDAIENPAKSARQVLGANRIGAETIKDEVATNSFVSTSTQAVAVGTGALKGEQSGLGPLRTTFGYLRTGIGLPSYLLGQAVISSTKLGLLLIALALSFVIGVAAVQFLVDGAELSESVLLIAAGIAAAFYLWVAVVDGSVSFWLTAAGLLVIAVAALVELLPSDPEGARLAIGIGAVVVIGLGLFGAGINRRPMQFVFITVTLGGAIGFILYGDMVLQTEELSLVPWVWGFLPVGALLLAHFSLFVSPWIGPISRRSSDEMKQRRRSTRMAARVLATHLVLFALAAFDVAVLARLAPEGSVWVKTTDFISEHRVLLVIGVLALPVILGTLVRPGWRWRRFFGEPAS